MYSIYPECTILHLVKKKKLPGLVACTAKKASYAPGVYISTWISDQHKK
jgi:hypothetical protein